MTFLVWEVCIVSSENNSKRKSTWSIDRLKCSASIGGFVSSVPCSRRTQPGNQNKLLRCTDSVWLNNVLGLRRKSPWSIDRLKCSASIGGFGAAAPCSRRRIRRFSCVAPSCRRIQEISTSGQINIGVLYHDYSDGRTRSCVHTELRDSKTLT